MKTPAPLTTKFLEDLKISMKNLKIQQTKLARDIGVSNISIFRYFQRSRNPTSEILLRLMAWMKETIKLFMV